MSTAKETAQLILDKAEWEGDLVEALGWFDKAALQSFLQSLPVGVRGLLVQIQEAATELEFMINEATEFLSELANG